MLNRSLAVLALAVLVGCGGDRNPNAPTPRPSVAPTPVPTPIPIWTVSGQGNQVFDMPTRVSRVRIQGTWNRTGTSNFIVWIGGRLIVNSILRDSINYDGTHLLSPPGGVTETRSSDNIAWTFTEIRN